jgi:HK97 family phage prohead protease
MNIHSKPAPLLTRRAATGGAASWDAKTRTFRAIIAAGAGVPRADWDGGYLEFLDPAGVEVAERVSVLNAHRNGDVADVVGTVENVERIGDRLEAVIRMSRRPEVEGIVNDIADGILTGVSVGYQILKFVESESADGARVKTAVRWRLLEVSLVPVPADSGAHIRSKENMTTNTDPAAPEEITSPAVRAPRGTRAATETEVRALAHVAKLDDDFVREQIDAGATMAQVRAAAIDALAIAQSRQPATRSYIAADAGVGGLDNPEVRSRAMADAIVARAGLPGFEPSPAARQFVGLSLPEMARESLRLAGVDVRGLSPSQVVQRALGGLHGTSDFANALSGAVGTVLRAAYTAAPSGLRQVARVTTLSDFRSHAHVSMSGFSALEKVNEHGEFRRGTIADGAESVKLETYGKIFGATRQAIVNDDLNALSDMPRRLGVAAAQFEAQLLADLLTANPKMSDGTDLFHASHSNLASAGAAPSEETLSAARVALRTQKDAAGQLIGLVPRFLIVGPELETSAEKLMTTIAAATTDDVQPIRLSVVVEPRIAGKEWHVACDPAHCDGLILAHLDGEPGPQIETRQGFDVDGVEFKVRLDVGAAFIDHRSWFKNPGA